MKNDFDELFKERLKEILEKRRKALGWSQAKVGYEIGGDSGRSQYSRLIGGQIPQFKKLFLVCEVLGLKPSKVISQIEKEFGL